MGSLRSAGLGLATTLVVAAVLAGNASAAPSWLLCLEGKNEKNTKYENSSCDKAVPTGKWESVGLPAGGKASIEIVNFTLGLTDREAGPLKEKSSVRCDRGGREAGVVTSPNTGEIREATVEGAREDCARVEGFCKTGEVEKVAGVDLPWKLELFETEKNSQTKISSGGSGEPGWEVKCNTMLGSRTDTCLTGSGKPELWTLFNELSGSGIRYYLIIGRLLRRALFKCSEGGAESGSVEGTSAILSAVPAGEGLSISG
jgi:hypothetical protein